MRPPEFDQLLSFSPRMYSTGLVSISTSLTLALSITFYILQTLMDGRGGCCCNFEVGPSSRTLLVFVLWFLFKGHGRLSPILCAQSFEYLQFLRGLLIRENENFVSRRGVLLFVEVLVIQSGFYRYLVRTPILCGNFSNI